MTESNPSGLRQWRFTLPPGATDILLIRHGESMPAIEDDPAPITDGHSDPDLAPEGREQAQRVAERLAGEGIAAMYVTSLRRTAQTAQPLANRLGLVPVVVPDLREVGLGSWEGYLFRKYTSEVHPIAVQMFTEQRWDVIPGAEPTDEFEERVRRGITEIAAAHPNQRVAVFAHGGVIGMALALASEAARFAFVGSDNGSISQLVVQGDRWQIRRFNDTAHLA